MSITSTPASIAHIPQYEVRPEDADAIIRISAYHRRDFNLSVIWFPPRTHANILTSPPPISSKTSTACGELARLPLELLQKICLELDVASLLRFRQTNVRARQIVDSLREFRIVTTHGMNALCALLRTNSTATVTLRDFHRLLHTQSCSLCGKEYGGMVNLLLWIRCCSSCLIYGSGGVCVTTPSAVERYLKLSSKALAALPSLRILPGLYSMSERLWDHPMTIVSSESALKAYREENAGVEASEVIIEQLHGVPYIRYMAHCALPGLDLQTGQFEDGISCASCHSRSGRKSVAPTTERWTDEPWVAVYSRKGFLEHFSQCEGAQLLWTSSDGGRIQPPQLSAFCRNGGSFKDRQ